MKSLDAHSQYSTSILVVHFLAYWLYAVVCCLKVEELVVFVCPELNREVTVS
jgi:hypothetical protein